MITLTVILLVLFVPSFRRALGRLFWGLLAAVGIVFVATRDSRTIRRGL